MKRPKKSFFVMYFHDRSACGPFDSYRQAKEDPRSKEATKIVQCSDDDACRTLRSWKLNTPGAK